MASSVLYEDLTILEALAKLSRKDVVTNDIIFIFYRRWIKEYVSNQFFFQRWLRHSTDARFIIAKNWEDVNNAFQALQGTKTPYDYMRWENNLREFLVWYSNK